MSRKSSQRKRKKCIIVFAEDETDQNVLRELMSALRPDLSAAIVTRRHSPVLINDVEASAIPGRIASITALIDAEKVTADVVGVFVHEDADNFPPHDVKLAEKIETSYAEAGYAVVAVTPSWETEAWMFLWPKAVAAYRPKWHPLDDRPRDVSMIRDAKEALRRDLRPKGKRAKTNPVPDYRTTDAAEIARKVRELDLARSPVGKSDSYVRFSAAVDGLSA